MSYKNVLFSVLAFLLAFQWAGAYAATEQVTYVHTDHLGSPILGRDAQGNTVFEYDYAPYGARKTYLGSPGTLGYTGHAQHDDMGLVYAGARWMEPEAGRFLSPDPVRFGEGGAKYFNRYAYVDNNPFRFYDPSGAYIESAWDVANLAIGLASLSSNVSDGNWGGAALDGAGLLVDGVATVVPILPAGAGTAIKAGRVAKGGERAATGFKGSKGFELKNAPYQKVRNEATSINGRDFSGHALDQMQNRGIMPSVVDNAIKTGETFSTRAGATGFYDAANKIRVITNSETGRVVTVIRGAPK